MTEQITINGIVFIVEYEYIEEEIGDNITPGTSGGNIINSIKTDEDIQNVIDFHTLEAIEKKLNN